MSSIKQRLILLGAAAYIAAAGHGIGMSETYGGKPDLVPYNDIGGVPTWCYGDTVGTPKARYTVQECDRLLLKRVNQVWEGISSNVPADAPDSVKEAMLSVAYNVGVTGWRHTLFTVPLAVRDWRAACEAIRAPWPGKYGVSQGFKATVNGRPVRGLENRRLVEYKTCIRDL